MKIKKLSKVVTKCYILWVHVVHFNIEATGRAGLRVPKHEVLLTWGLACVLKGGSTSTISRGGSDRACLRDSPDHCYCHQSFWRSSHYKIPSRASKYTDTAGSVSSRLQKASPDHKHHARGFPDGSTKPSTNQPSSYKASQLCFKVLLQEKRLNEVWVQCNKPSLFIKLWVINVCMVTV